MHRRVAGTERCRQHPILYCCPFCEHMPDGATVRLCIKHESRRLAEERAATGRAITQAMPVTLLTITFENLDTVFRHARETKDVKLRKLAQQAYIQIDEDTRGPACQHCADVVNAERRKDLRP